VQLIERRRPSSEVIGSITVLQHCTFPWTQPIGGTTRYVAILPEHCERCLAMLLKLSTTMRFVVDRRAASYPLSAPPHRRRGSRRSARGRPGPLR
jgi:hypothetical protein